MSTTRNDAPIHGIEVIHLKSAMRLSPGPQMIGTPVTQPLQNLEIDTNKRFVEMLISAYPPLMASQLIFFIHSSVTPSPQEAIW